METTAWCANYQRRVTGATKNFVGILSGLVHVSNSQTAEGWDNSDVCVAMLSRKPLDHLGSGWACPTMITSNGTTRRFAVVSRARNHCQSPLGIIQCLLGKWPDLKRRTQFGDLGLVPFGQRTDQPNHLGWHTISAKHSAKCELQTLA